MRKIEIDENITNEIIHDYTVNYMGSPLLSEKYGIPKRIILRILKENGCDVGKSGRKYKGGKKEAGGKKSCTTMFCFKQSRCKTSVTILVKLSLF